MAFSLAVNALSYYRISAYKTVTLILTLFFLYDVFMVFITPAFTKVPENIILKKLILK